MNVIEFDFSLEYGFAWMIIEKETKVLTVQCYLDSGDDNCRIIKSDCGHTWGLCGDANEEAFTIFGEHECMSELFKRSEEAGIEVTS